MDRKVPFQEGEIYHVYSRGVEKREVFCTESDYVRFTLLLLLANKRQSINLRSIQKRYRGESLVRAFNDFLAEHFHTDILSYSLMPNHFHLILREKKEGGVSAFMHKLVTSYSMYFNKKNDRSGPLFTRPFRSQHVDTDEYFRWLFAYVHLNPLELTQPGWSAEGIDMKAARTFMRQYAFSSFYDFFVGRRPQSVILNKTALPVTVDELGKIDDWLTTLAISPDLYQGLPSV